MKTILKEKINRLFAQWDKPSSPGFALAIVKNEKILYECGYGMASLEHNVPISPVSVFDIGSTSKQFVAFCIAILAKNRKISLGDDIRKHVPEIPEYKYPVTIYQLLHHTSGLRDYLTLMELAGMRFENEYPEDEVIGLVARQKEVNFKPGSEFLYSNTGYLLLGEVVKRVSEMSLADFARENIFSPLGMKNTHFHDDFSRVVKNKAAGYASSGREFKAAVSILDLVGDGGVNTTVEDLYLWDRNFYSNKLAGGGQGIIDQVTTPGKLNDGRRLCYSYGLFVTPYREMPLISHGGGWVGYRSEILRFPEKKFSVICLSNLETTNPTRIAKQVADLCLPEGFPEGRKARRRDSLVRHEHGDKAGFYFSQKTCGIIEITVKDGEVSLSSTGAVYPLTPSGQDRFTTAGDAFVLSFEKPTAEAGFRVLTEKEREMPDVYQQVSAKTARPRTLKSFAGEYYCAELGAAYRIILEGGELHLVRKGAGKEKLRPVFDNMFIGDWLTVWFAAPAHGTCSRFKLGAGRVRSLLFRRTELHLRS